MVTVEQEKGKEQHRCSVRFSLETFCVHLFRALSSGGMGREATQETKYANALKFVCDRMQIRFASSAIEIWHCIFSSPMSRCCLIQKKSFHVNSKCWMLFACDDVVLLRISCCFFALRCFASSNRFLCFLIARNVNVQNRKKKTKALFSEEIRWTKKKTREKIFLLLFRYSEWQKSTIFLRFKIQF